MARPTTIAPVLPSVSTTKLQPVGLANARIEGGFWAERLRRNLERTIPHGAAMLESRGNLHNFALAIAGGGSEEAAAAYRSTATEDLPFFDSDVTKWLEAVGWQLARADDAALRGLAEPMIELIERAQRPDGYVDTYYQVARPGREFQELHWGHELYVAGHLVQAAVAWKRGLNDDRLLRVAERFVARIAAEIGPGRREGICGHPEFEMALVELYRLTGNRGHLEFARTLVERRGHGLLGKCSFGPRYWQDHESVRTAREPAGHAVRQLYLDCGAVDVAVETGDRELLEAVVRRWEAMVGRFTYITGGLGAHHRDEAFGEAFELPSDRAYAETCAAIASCMLSWRLLLATGEERFADLIERTTFNAVLPALSLDGCHFFYTNPLLRRSNPPMLLGVNQASTRRIAWPGCACCPPNLMRYLASWADMAVTASDAGLQVHQYLSGRFGAEVGDGAVEIATDTNYPWDGEVSVRIVRTIDEPWTLSLRVPAWCENAVATIDGEPVEGERGDGVRTDRIDLRRTWRAGAVVRLSLEMRPRITEPDPRIDAVRGSVALERGPLVYAVEDADLPEGASVESLEIDSAAPLEVERRDEAGLGEMVWLSFGGVIRADQPALWPYAPAGARADSPTSSHRIRAIPYFAWGNRPRLGMRVWIPKR